MQTRFTAFLEQFIYYCCSRCVLGVQGHPIQRNKGDGRHAHNGEILPHLAGVEPTADRIIAAYQRWCAVNKIHCEEKIARAYTQGQPSATDDPTMAAVRMIFEYEHSTWLRHGLELPNQHRYGSGEPFPPMNSRHRVGIGGHSEYLYAVDTDRWPFRAFDEHPVENCMGPPWVYTTGVLPLERFSGSLRQLADRDHYYAYGTELEDRWLYLYRELDEHAQDPLDQNRARDALLASNLPRIHWEEYSRLETLIRHLRNLANAEQRCQR